MEDKLHEITIPLYNQDLWVFFGDGQKCLEALEQQGISECCRKAILDEMNKRNNGLFVQDEIEQFNLVWLSFIPRDGKYVKVVSSMIWLATFSILDYAGVKHTEDSDDAYAYLHQYICEEVYNLLNSNN